MLYVRHDCIVTHITIVEGADPLPGRNTSRPSILSDIWQHCQIHRLEVQGPIHFHGQLAFEVNLKMVKNLQYFFN